MRRRAAWVVRAAADPECRVFVNHGGRLVIFYYCKPNSTLIHTLRDRRGRRGLVALGCVNALNPSEDAIAQGDPQCRFAHRGRGAAADVLCKVR